MLQTNEIIKTGLTANYVGYWTIAQGIKEAAQNIVYGGIKSEMKPQITYADGVCTMEDTYVGFEKRHLYLGESEQRQDEDGIGNFGEGWKMFLLVAARNGLNHRVETVGFSFYGVMVDTPHGVKALEIVVEENDRELGTKVTIDCSEEDFNRGTQGFAIMQDIPKEDCGELSLIPNRFGELYINLARIENNETTNPLDLKYAYHIKDRSLMNRDRSQVDVEKVHGLISRIWATQEDEDVILEYVQSAYNGETQQDVQRGPSGAYVPYSNRQKWIEAVAKIMGCEDKQLVLTSRDADLDGEAEYRGYVVVKMPDKWNYFLSWMGVKEVREVVTAKVTKMQECEIEGLTEEEKQIFKKAKIDAKKALNLNSVKSLPTIKVVEEIQDANNVMNAVGLYDKETKIVYLKREVLGSQKDATSTLIHECVHWVTNASDGSEWFVRGFEHCILNLLGYNK